MNINDIPSDLLHKIRQQFEQNPQVQHLRIQQRCLQERGDYKGAINIGKSLEELYITTIHNYMEEAEKEVKSIEIDDIDMKPEDKEHIMMLGLVMFMAADLIESAVLDVDDTLHKYDKELHFEMFNDIRQLSQMASEKLKFLQNNSGYMKDLVWADKCDDMYNMIQSKARSIINKRKNDPDWGKSMERLVKGK